MTDEPYTEKEVQEALTTSMESSMESKATRRPNKVTIGLILAVLAMSVTGLIQTLVIVSWSHQAQEATTVSKQSAEDARAAAEQARIAADVAACQLLFDNKVSDARDVKADASYDVTFELGRQLLESGASHPPTAFNPLPILAAAAKRDQAETDYEAVLDSRDQWLSAGKPLPCPTKPEGT